MRGSRSTESDGQDGGRPGSGGPVRGASTGRRRSPSAGWKFLIAFALVVAGVSQLVASGGRTPAFSATPTPITHVVIFYQENHTFDDVLGAFCNTTKPARCDGAISGQVATGQTVPLAPGPDIVPTVTHASKSQVTAINGGKMNGFSKLSGCAAPTYSCYLTYKKAREPNVWALASKFAVSDRTFEMNPVPTWGAHVELVTSLLDGFQGDNPTGVTAHGWGCDSCLLYTSPSPRD